MAKPSRHRRAHTPDARRQPRGGTHGGGGYWLYGQHACEAALVNDARHIRRALFTAAAQNQWQGKLSGIPAEITDAAGLAKLLGEGAVHQGIALLVDPLDEADWDQVLASKPTVLMLDQVTDPHNVGAMLRSAAAFGVGALLMPRDHAPAESGAMAKAACGALDLVPVLRVTNLVKTLGELKAQGYWIVGLDGEAEKPITAVRDYHPLCLVMGAEGNGMRRLTREHCDLLVHIPIQARMESLNVSNAAAIALFCAYRAG